MRFNGMAASVGVLHRFHCFKVRRVHAPTMSAERTAWTSTISVVAEMIDSQSLWDCPNGQLVGNTVGQLAAPVDVEPAITALDVRVP
jgi:hypothetical protein